ncbi:type II secretion system protein GspM [Lysobacter solisilvae (ex Woo and Kim 2020)]|uniref:Type II secretion system protein M n=1 Tax=Agrilutibacter terrestris TaxID=2865112 RepID=A0A7H0FZB6_9GAMM|nr:type II secretion system protein GspM [Lysobacter terrestris]QNP41382.1 type II secretion system protein M [Lysobacter terrestris]
MPVNDRDRWLALGLLAAVLLLAYAVLIHPWFTVPMRAVGERIDGARERELRLRTEINQAPVVRQRLQQARAALARTPGFLPERSPELATAALVQRLEAVVSQASPGRRACEITNRSPLQEPPREKYPRVTIQVRLRCGTPELANVLHSLEGGMPRLFVGNLNVLGQRVFFNPGQSGTQGGLDVSFDLYGYLQPGAVPPRPQRAAPLPGGNDDAL